MLTKWKYELLIIFVALLHLKTKNSTLAVNTKDDYLLPNAIIPNTYELQLNIVKTSKFTGTVKIKATVQRKTNTIVLSASYLEIRVTTIRSGNHIITVHEDNIDYDFEKYSIELINYLEKGSDVLIELFFSGDYTNDLTGLHNIFYFDKSGEERRIVATQFSPFYARDVFPCFDEPAFKANFTIRIKRSKNYVALSNMPLQNSGKVPKKSYYLDVFENSMKMSTHSVGFVVGDLKSTSIGSITIWTRDDLQDQATYALKTGAIVLKTLEFFLNDSYPISKLNMVALPTMYLNAIENWGLIIFRENTVLFDRKESSVVVRQNIAQIITHVISHMWFRNLVNPDWWRYFWLQKSFAGYYEYKILSEILPSWGMTEQILLTQQNALLEDSSDFSESLTLSFMKPSVHKEIFNSISYKKGISILRMMSLTFGPKVFDCSSLEYFRQRKYKTGKPEELFSILQKNINSNLPASVETIMNSWTTQSGYPVLSVTVRKNQVELNQHLFAFTKRNLKKKWWIPVTWYTKTNTYIDTIADNWIFDGKTITVQKEEYDWIIFNVQGAGFYRVNYDIDSWNRILQCLSSDNFEKITVLNRAAIVDDLLNLARANLVDYKLAFECLNYLRRETNYLPFKSAFNALAYVTRRFNRRPIFGSYSRYILRCIQNIHIKLGFKGRNDTLLTNNLLRRELNMIACNFDHHDCVEKSLNYFKKWKNGEIARVSRNLKSVVYTTAMRRGTAEDWQFLWSKYNATNSVSEQTEIINALSCIPDFNIISQHLSSFLIKSNNNVMYGSNLKDVISSILSCNSFGVEILIEFVDNNHKELLRYFRNNWKEFEDILRQITNYLSTPYLFSGFEYLIRTIATNNKFKHIATSFDHLLDPINSELTSFKNTFENLTKWLQEQDNLEHSYGQNYKINREI